MNWQALRRRIGHRGAFLLTAGAYDIFYGWYLAINGSIEHVPLIPEAAWGWLWITAGLVLWAGAWFKRDAPFFATGILIKTVWALEFFRLQYQAHVPGDWLRGCYWLALAGAMMVAATWPEPVTVLTPPPPVPVTAEQTVQRARDA